MTEPLKAVLLDLDGTLLDTAPDFFNIANLLLARYDRPPLAYPQFRQSVSDGARGMVHAAFGYDHNDPRFEPLRLEFLALYAEHLADHSTPFAGIAAGFDIATVIADVNRLPGAAANLLAGEV
jgi:phosphoglycolate phosphatase